jgi:hypothetical protein
MNNKYYKESGNVDLMNLFLGIIISLIFTFIFGYLYSLLMYFIPIIYFNIIISIGFGFIVSLLIRLIIRIGKIRNKKFRILISVLIILFMTYFQWISFIDSILLDKYPSITESLYSINWILNPSEFFNIIGQINENGTWGLGASGGFPVKGISLTFIWLVEILIFTLPTIKMLYDFKVYPYSEKFNKWYPKYTIDEYFESLYSKNSIEPLLDSGVIQTLSNLNEANEGRHSKIHLHFLDNETSQYLSIDRVWIEGKGNIKELPVLSNYKIKTETAIEIKNLFKLNKEKINIV